ncbi:Prolipoprotein diacylglyceryl transferase [Planctomycetes bacterium Pan216]|uniref:Phosphatidylglycerol--prolipoprotein diacylglyceryl transferase n=1 Tax=Kolteria novifilia TaxID=2527975 RepID=A0A518B5V6_9BACT|nr:Prolipoprotein diacylglyceryl transferase [Planctomycetes bacterium Pan216]
MRQVLFEIFGWPIYGYGLLVVIAFYSGTRLAARRAQRENIDPNLIWDLAFWLFVGGIFGARLFFVIQKWDQFLNPIAEFFALWRGGLVVYGAAIGGLAAFLLFARLKSLRGLQLLDIITPSLALGMGIGRLGCLMNGCCYGDYCEQSWALRFPAGSPPAYRMTSFGHQSPLGFVVNPNDARVLFLEPGSSAALAGLRTGDRVLKIQGEAIEPQPLLNGRIADILKMKEDFQIESAPYTLEVARDGKSITLNVHAPWSLPVQPTQIYSSISGFLLFFFLSAYYPLRRRIGEVTALFAMLYAIGRFLVEFLRFDERPLFDGLTISQNISIIFFVCGLAFWLWLRFSGKAPTRTAPG